MKLKRLMALIVLMSVLASSLNLASINKTKVTLASSGISSAERNAFYKNSAFIGSSIGVGLNNYFKAKGSGYLGGPKMLVRGCYSFMNDERNNTPYIIHYKGVAMKARYALKAANVDRAFICMGTNDMWESPTAMYNRYVRYLKGIRSSNPDLTIFIQSTPPTRRSSGNLANRNVNAANALIKKYCESQKDMYYIDISTALKDSTGKLKSSYCSDGYCHLTFAGYAKWMSTQIAYTDRLMLDEKNAKAKLTAAQKKIKKLLNKSKTSCNKKLITKAQNSYATAKEYISRLDKSTLKTTLNAKLKSKKESIKKIKKNVNNNIKKKKAEEAKKKAEEAAKKAAEEEAKKKAEEAKNASSDADKTTASSDASTAVSSSDASANAASN
ncbi:MAG: hypothetical protein K5656_05675 [Lachnospiraceae bacterium]|nr:hypothetical protein [Lachnospiraceae bacterium]